jgi:hypothetical protein
MDPPIRGWPAGEPQRKDSRMARTPPLNRDALIGLGAERLAELALDEAGGNAAFKNLLTAAIAATAGPEAVAAIVDKRLAALEKAKGAIGSGRVRAFSDELSATLKIIAGDLAKADLEGAATRLLRLLATADRTFSRASDASEIAEIYHAAAAALPGLVRRLSDPETASLAEGLYALAADSSSAILGDSTPEILAASPPGVVQALDARLADAVNALGPIDPGLADWSRRARARRLIVLRQHIADVRSDVDAFIALESAPPGDVPDAAAIGERLIDAGRAREALDWLRRPARPSIKMLTMADLHVGLPPRDPAADRRAQVEIRAHEALGDRDAAQALRWRLFTETLDADMLREHIARLPDFEDVEALDRAFSTALASPLLYAALRFFIRWPRLDLAERLAVERRQDWDGQRYEALAPAADALEPKHPLGAAVLYRALIDSILGRGQSIAYGHAARYYAALEGLEAREAAGWPIEPHRHYRTELRRRHGRKLGFWSRVEGAERR